MPSPKKKPALGRGLGSLMGEAQSETGYTATETQMSIEEIFPNPNQPRTHFNESELEELSESIRENGVLQPLLVRKNGSKYEIIAGERRYQASKIAGLDKVPVIVKDVDDQKMLEIALIENLQRSDLNPIEEAMAFKRLLTEFYQRQWDDAGGFVEGGVQVTICHHELSEASRSARGCSADDV